MTANYEIISNAFTVFDVANPIDFYYKPEKLLAEAYEDFFMNDSIIPELAAAIVEDENRLYGYITFDTEGFTDSEDETVTDIAEYLDPHMIISCQMPLLDLVPLFEESYFYFILTRNRITHWVSFNDLDCLPMKVSLFVLFLELEQAMIALITSNLFDLKNSLKQLKNKRIEKAKDLYKFKYKTENTDSYKLLLCTTFVDKKEIISLNLEVYKKIRIESKNKTDRLFRRIEQIRNRIAHSDTISDLIQDPHELNEFVSNLKIIVSSIQALVKETSNNLAPEYQHDGDIPGNLNMTNIL